MITVIGGGPAGRFAAMQIARAGIKVRIVEKRGSLGGQCLNHGCMVVCGLNDCARTIESINKLSELSILPKAEYPILLENLWTEMKKIQTLFASVSYKETIGAGVEVIYGEARIDGRDLFIDGVKQDEQDAVIIASGSVPDIPDIPGIGLDGVYNPHTLFSMKTVPKNPVIIGGGVIAAEYAYIFSRFGSKTVVVSRSAFLRKAPEEIRRSSKRELSGVDILENADTLEITGSQSVKSVRIKCGGTVKEIETDAVIIAAGLKPNTSFASGFEKDEHGAFIVDENFMTSVKGVYAAGDATGKMYLTPYARAQGAAAAKAVLGEKPEMPKVVPQAVRLCFEHGYCSKPECSSMDRQKYSAPAQAGHGSFWTASDKYTGYSAVEISDDGELLSASLTSPSAGAVISYISYLMESGITAADFEKFTEIHPSADGIYPLLKYNALPELKNKNKNKNQTKK